MLYGYRYVHDVCIVEWSMSFPTGAVKNNVSRGWEGENIVRGRVEEEGFFNDPKG